MFYSEWNRGVIDPEPELVIDIGEGDLILARLFDAASAEGDVQGLR